MQGQENQNQSENVISLFAARKAESAAQADAAATADAAKTEEAAKPGESFEDVMRRNQANKDRLAKERSSANKSVLRSYRIKN